VDRVPRRCPGVEIIDAIDPGRLVGVGGLAVHARNRNDANGRLQDMRSSAFLQSAYATRSSRCPNAFPEQLERDRPPARPT